MTRSRSARPPLKDVAAELTAALRLVAHVSPDPSSCHTRAEKVDAAFIKKCIAMCDKGCVNRPRRFRTLHHFACSGGTLVSRAVATMPNVRLLSEVDPLSELPFQGNAPKFVPTDLVGLLRHGTKPVARELIVDSFRAAMTVIHAHTEAVGQYLVIRDHAHGHYCYGTDYASRPSLRDLLTPEAPVLSVVTVRHPVDSFASLLNNGWIHFSPGTLDEYAKRYLAFLDRCRDVPIYRYEDFVMDPGRILQGICSALELPASEFREDLLESYVISGDSGRAGNRISARERRDEATQLLNEARSSDSMILLCKTLNYPLH